MARNIQASKASIAVVDGYLQDKVPGSGGLAENESRWGGVAQNKPAALLGRPVVMFLFEYVRVCPVWLAA